MAKKKKVSPVVQTRWGIKNKVHHKIAVYKELHQLESLEIAANILLEKATLEIQLPG